MAMLGMFTKTVYPSDYDKSKIQECCTVIPDDKANDEDFINARHVSDLVSCLGCFGCPAAMQSRV